MPCSWASSHMVAASTPPPRCACSSASGSSAAKTWFTEPADRPALLRPQDLLELAVLEHLGDDVAAADQPAVDEELRDRRPLRPAREHDPDARVDQDVARAVVRADVVQDLDHLVREPAARHLGGALHVKEHAVLRDLALDLVEDLLLGHRDRVGHVISGARVLRASAWMLPSSSRLCTAA